MDDGGCRGIARSGLAQATTGLEEEIDGFPSPAFIEALLALERTRPPPAPIGTRRRVLARIRAWLQQSPPV